MNRLLFILLCTLGTLTHCQWIQAVPKILADGKVEIFFVSEYSIEARQSEDRLSVETVLEQYTCRQSVVVRRMRN